MTQYVGVGGAWKAVSARWTGVGGAWKVVQSGWVGVSGVWKPFFITFSPFTTNYDTPGTFTVTIPLGASLLTVYATGGGGGGVTLSNSGGGAGTAVYENIPISTNDWLKTFSITVAAGGPNSFPNHGPNTTVNLTVDAGSYSLTGGGGSPDDGVAGGTATGGTTNITGGVGELWPAHNPATGGVSFWASGGVGNANGSLGSGGGGTGSGAGQGGAGRVRVNWS